MKRLLVGREKGYILLHLFFGSEVIVGHDISLACVAPGKFVLSALCSGQKWRSRAHRSGPKWRSTSQVKWVATSLFPRLRIDHFSATRHNEQIE